MRPTVKRFWEALPKPMQDVVAMVIDGLGGVEVPQPPTADLSKPIRLFIAPANYAGQGYQWARAAQRDDRVFARNMVYAEINPFAYPVDYPVRGRTVTHHRAWQRAQLDALTRFYTHLLVEAEMPPLGGLWNQDVRRQVRALQAGGVSVGMVCHGSDIRSPHLHRQTERWSPFADDSWVPVDALERVVAGNKRLLADLDVPTFVSTPGLLVDVPYGHLLPVVIDDDAWHSTTDPLRRRVPRVIHAPSNPLVKGTAEIEPILFGLEAEGLIEYLRVQGRPHEEMAELYGTADVVLDQFRLGDYGAAACEAMASGRLVVSHVSEQARDTIRREAGAELPILEANLDSLESVLRRLLADRSPARELAAAGPEFVRRVHHGDFSAGVLRQYFLES